MELTLDKAPLTKYLYKAENRVKCGSNNYIYNVVQKMYTFFVLL